jgi:crossover junction endodeoxyribonuclease RuvC
MRVLGIDPGIRRTGWGVIAFENNRMRHLGNGAICPNPALADTERLRLIHDGLTAVIAQYQPDWAAIEQIFVAKSAASALRLGMAAVLA